MNEPRKGPHGLRRNVQTQTDEEMLRFTEEALTAHPDCPHLLIRKAILIQIQDDPDKTPGLDVAERCLLEAHALDEKYLAALEELAHFYDAVYPDPVKARSFAERYIELATPALHEMTRIRDDRE